MRRTDLLAQADRFRQLANGLTFGEDRDVLLRMAEEFEAKAKVLDEPPAKPRS
jgi:hypothetical protein